MEGYVESIATGLMAGIHAAALASERNLLPPPRPSAFGSLIHYVTHADAKNFQPANITSTCCRHWSTKSATARNGTASSATWP